MLWLVRLAAIAAFVLLILSHRPEYTSLADLATDPGPGGANIAYVGVGPGAGVADFACPIGITNMERGHVAIIDRDTHRLLNFNVETRGVTSARNFSVDPRLYVNAAVYESNRLWVWVQDSPGEIQAALPLFSNDGGPFDLGDFDVTPDILAKNARGFFSDARPEVRRRFEALGFPLPGQPRTPTLTRPSPTSWADSVEAAMAAPAAASAAPSSPPLYALSYNLSGRNKLTVAITDPGGGARSVTLRTNHDIVFAEALRTDDFGNVFVLVTAENDGPELYDIRQTVYRIGTSGAKPQVAAFSVPLKGNGCVPKQHVEVTPMGDVLFLRVLEDRVSVLKLKKRNWLSWFADPWPLPQLGSLVSRSAFALLDEVAARANAAFVEVDDNKPISRREVIDNACKMTKVEWRNPAALPTSAGGTLCSCSGKTDGKCAYRAPGAATHDVAADPQGLKTFKGLPYNWGGFDRYDAFNTKMSRVGAQRRPAGDVCIKYKPTDAAYDAMAAKVRDALCSTNAAGDRVCYKEVIADPNPQGSADRINSSFASGIDCSGFVMRAWGSKRVPIGKLDTKAFRKDNPVAIGLGGSTLKKKFDRLKPGDALNEPSGMRHIVLFGGWWRAGDPTKFEIMDSSTDCGGACSRPWFAHEVVSFRPVQLRRIVDDMTSPRNSPALTDAELPMCPDVQP